MDETRGELSAGEDRIANLKRRNYLTLLRIGQLATAKRANRQPGANLTIQNCAETETEITGRRVEERETTPSRKDTATSVHLVESVGPKPAPEEKPKEEEEKEKPKEEEEKEKPKEEEEKESPFRPQELKEQTARLLKGSRNASWHGRVQKAYYDLISGAASRMDVDLPLCA